MRLTHRMCVGIHSYLVVASVSDGADTCYKQATGGALVSTMAHHIKGSQGRLNHLRWYTLYRLITTTFPHQHGTIT